MHNAGTQCTEEERRPKGREHFLCLNFLSCHKIWNFHSPCNKGVLWPPQLKIKMLFKKEIKEFLSHSNKAINTWGWLDLQLVSDVWGSCVDSTSSLCREPGSHSWCQKRDSMQQSLLTETFGLRKLRMRGQGWEIFDSYMTSMSPVVWNYSYAAIQLLEVKVVN